MSGSTQQKAMVITGAFGARGAATARAAAKSGARVFLLDQAAEPSAGLMEAWGPGARTKRCRSRSQHRRSCRNARPTGNGGLRSVKISRHRLIESLAEELKKDRITVNAVLPSIIDTPSNRAQMSNADHSSWVAPEALAAIILLLASDLANAIIGALLPVSGRV